MFFKMSRLITVIVIGTVCAQNDPPLSIKFNEPDTTKYVCVGEQLNITCEINRPVLFVNNVQIVLKSAHNETILTHGLTKKGPDSDNYSVKFSQFPENGIGIHFYISNVSDFYNGTLICRTIDHENIGSASLNTVVLRLPMDALYLKFDEYEIISKSITDPIKVDPGNHSVVCIAEGSNPDYATNVILYLNGSNVQTVEKLKSEKLQSNCTGFRTTLKATVLINIFGNEQEIECVVVSQSGGSRSVKLPIKMKIYNPEVQCNDTKAKKGQKNVVLSCTVDYSDVDIESFQYSLGDKIYNAGEKHEFFEVSREKLSDSKVRVHLILKEAKDFHFTSEFYLLIKHYDGRVTRYSVRHHLIPDNCTTLRASLVILLMSLFVQVITYKD